MPDNLKIAAVTSGLPVDTGLATREITYSGQSGQHCGVDAIVTLSGADDAKVATDVPFPSALHGSGGFKVAIVGDDIGSGVEPGTDYAYVIGRPETPYSNIDLGTTGQVVKNAPGRILSGILINRAADWRYVKVYDKATAATSGDVPTWRIGIPPSSVLVWPSFASLPLSAGISLRGTTGVLDNDTGAPAANDIIVNLLRN